MAAGDLTTGALWQARAAVVALTVVLTTPLVTAATSRLAATVKCFLEPANHRCLDCRGCGTHELAHLFELGHDSLALYTELLREFVNPNLRHYAPLLSPSNGP